MGIFAGLTIGALVSGVLISGVGFILIYYAKAVGRLPPAIIGAAMCAYPFFVFNVWWLWGITVVLLIALYMMREKE